MVIDVRPIVADGRFEANHVADEHRLLELDAVDRDGDDLDVRRPAA